MAYAWKAKITIDRTKCGSVDSANFTFPFAGTYTALKLVANGGCVENGEDLAFFLDEALTTQLAHKKRRYDGTTGAVAFDVMHPLITVAVDPECWVACGDPAVTTDQSNVAGTWGSESVLVPDFGDGTTLTATDDSGNGNHGTITGAVAASGPIYGAASLDGANDKIDFGSGASVDNLATKTVVLSLKRGTVSATGDHVLFAKVHDPSGFGGWWLYIRRDSDGTNGGKLKFAQAWTGATFESAIWRASTPLNSTSPWYRIAVTYDNGSTGNDPIFYVNGVAETTVEEQSPGGTVKSDAAYNLLLGERGYGDLDLLALVADARVVSVIRSPSWLAADANAYLSPSTFYSVGTFAMVVACGVGRAKARAVASTPVLGAVTPAAAPARSRARAVAASVTLGTMTSSCAPARATSRPVAAAVVLGALNPAAAPARARGRSVPCTTTLGAVQPSTGIGRARASPVGCTITLGAITTAAGIARARAYAAPALVLTGNVVLCGVGVARARSVPSSLTLGSVTAAVAPSLARGRAVPTSTTLGTVAPACDPARAKGTRAPAGLQLGALTPSTSPARALARAIPTLPLSAGAWTFVCGVGRASGRSRGATVGLGIVNVMVGIAVARARAVPALGEPEILHSRVVRAVIRGGPELRAVVTGGHMLRAIIRGGVGS